MEIIIGHNNTDFDCLASMIAARKLYPEAQLVLPGNIGREVREFINMYMDVFNFIESGDVECEKLTRIIIVDTHSTARIGKFKEYVAKPGIEVIIYDHHILCEDEISSAAMKIEEVGANTTILIEELMEKGIDISPVEATILALGIYVDTNSLIFSGTTSRDAHALGYLLEKEANLSVIESLIINRLSTGQRELSQLLNKNIVIDCVNGFEVGFSLVEMEEYVDDAAYLTRKILEERDLDALFSIMRMGHKTYIIGRSITEEIDLSIIMKLIGGGGHKGAGSAKSDERDLQKISSNIKAVLRENVRPIIMAKDIMSSPVKTVPEDTTIDEAYDIMIKFGHSGMPVVSGNKIAGIISRRDIDKARVHGYGQSPVKGYMSKKVVTIDFKEPIKEVRELFAEHDIGRLPVLKDNEMIGIVTRTDVIRTLYGGKYQKRHKPGSEGSEIGKEYTSENLSYKLDELPPNVREVLALAGKVADLEGFSIYVVGGFVRDLILGVENLDIDIVVEGDAIAFARKFAETSKAVLTEYEKFQTAYAVLAEDLKIDIVTARKEYYEFPGALPSVERGSIKDDLFRRDFTINCIAMKLNGREFGKIVDFYGGRRDLYDGIIRILYNFSFIEDPTRILRAVRFEQRYGFKMDEKTEEFAIDAINSDVLDKLSRERINSEFFYMLKEKNTVIMLERMQELGLLEKIYPEIMLSDRLKMLMEKSDKHYDEFYNSLINKKNIDKILVYLLVLYSDVCMENVPVLSDRFRLSKEYRDEILRFAKVRDLKLHEILNGGEPSNYEIYCMFKGLALESLYMLSLMFDDMLKGAVLLYANNLSNIKTKITGRDLQELGISPGPQIKKILEIVLKEKINGKIFTRSEEIDYVKINLLDEEKEK
ncbi:CBS domain-containing protein [Acetivibrio cellulolyticus]|uniref:CBS domain-containing protein n=1 Tax=Acetivibrio cellulolyticus TaxID=35830 RepID=UPI0001E2F145|nr:CBS domain-containing protein [Acetivibrio cellulolyticus]